MYMMVKLSLCAAIAALAHAVVAEDAPQRPNQPNNVIILGRFQGLEKRIEGGIAFWSDDGWTKASVHLFGLPSEAGPFSYSINSYDVPKSGVCSEAGGVLNPFGGTKDAPTWAASMIGDLSGKHGKVDTSFYQKEYEDPYLAIHSGGLGDMGYIGHHAFVVTDKDGNDYACCNLVPYDRLGKMMDMNGEKVPEEFYSMLTNSKLG